MSMQTSEVLLAMEMGLIAAEEVRSKDGRDAAKCHAGIAQHQAEAIGTDIGLRHHVDKL